MPYKDDSLAVIVKGSLLSSQVAHNFYKTVIITCFSCFVYLYKYLRFLVRTPVKCKKQSASLAILPCSLQATCDNCANNILNKISRFWLANDEVINTLWSEIRNFCFAFFQFTELSICLKKISWESFQKIRNCWNSEKRSSHWVENLEVNGIEQLPVIGKSRFTVQGFFFF